MNIAGSKGFCGSLQIQTVITDQKLHISRMPDPKKAVIPGTIKKHVLVKTGNGDKYFLIVTRNPLPQNPLESGIFFNFYPESIVLNAGQIIFDLLILSRSKNSPNSFPSRRASENEKFGCLPQP
jgi:hypothetical protein